MSCSKWTVNTDLTSHQITFMFWSDQNVIHMKQTTHYGKNLVVISQFSMLPYTALYNWMPIRRESLLSSTAVHHTHIQVLKYNT